MMELFKRQVHRVKNVHSVTLERDFSYNAFSFLILALFLGGGVAWQIVGHPTTEMMHVVVIAIGGVFAGGMLTLFPIWSVAIQFIVLAWISMFALLDTTYTGFIALLTAGLILSPALQLVYHWDKVITLRLGHFQTVHGPGVFFLIPIIDRVAAFVDTRIRATDFSAENTITSDTVPVYVDALAFWMIWDAKKAVLEVEDFMEAVVLSAQTALRDSIGKHDLATLLSERDKLGKEIQKILDAKTNPWGISILSVEFTDIIIPKELEDAMSKQAQAERERQSRVILAGAEIEVAKKFEEAAESYARNPAALQLRAMNMVYEGIRDKASIMLLPSSALDQMNLGTTLGSAALRKQMESEDEARSKRAAAERENENERKRNPSRKNEKAGNGTAKEGEK